MQTLLFSSGLDSARQSVQVCFYHEAPAKAQQNTTKSTHLQYPLYKAPLTIQAYPV